MYHALQVCCTARHSASSHSPCTFHYTTTPISNIIQSPDDAVSPEQLAEYNTRISMLQTQTTELQTLAKTLRSTLASLNSTRSTADMLSNISSLEHEKSEIVTRLESLRAGHSKKVTAEERKKVEKEWKATKEVMGRREKIARVFWEMVEEGTERKETLEELREGWGMDD